VNWVPRFVDTGYWIALFSTRDQLHPRARALAQRLRGPLITTTAVVFEVVDGFAAASTRHLGRRFLDSVRTDPNLEVVPMTERGIIEALAADHHFSQAGFRALLRDP
jgi:predicted nucleic acid-binding protein